MIRALVVTAFVTSARAEPPSDEASPPVEALVPEAPADCVRTHEPGRYLVVRGCLSRWSPPDDPLGGARADVYRAGGRIDGLRLGAVEEGGLLHALGLRTGDVVHAVAGHALQDTRAKVAAWKAMQAADEVEVVLTREGERRTVVYVVVGASRRAL